MIGSCCQGEGLRSHNSYGYRRRSTLLRYKNPLLLSWLISGDLWTYFLDASLHLYKRVYPSVGDALTKIIENISISITIINISISITIINITDY